MSTFLVPTNSVHVSATLCDYLIDRVGTDDTVHAINSQVGSDDTTADDVRDGEDALNAVQSRLGAKTTVETHQFIRGNDPATDVLSYAEEIDADEIVIGLRKRNPTGKLLFGSVAQRILLNADRPMAVVPRAEL